MVRCQLADAFLVRTACPSNRQVVIVAKLVHQPANHEVDNVIKGLREHVETRGQWCDDRASAVEPGHALDINGAQW